MGEIELSNKLFGEVWIMGVKTRSAYKRQPLHYLDERRSLEKLNLRVYGMKSWAFYEQCSKFSATQEHGLKVSDVCIFHKNFDACIIEKSD